MKKKFNQLLDSKKFTGYLILVLFSAVTLITALIIGSNTDKKTILTNSLERMAAEDLGCPKDKNCNGPEHSKTRTSNNDGTYKISLDVKGDATTTTPKKANVIIVMDTSNSMNNATEERELYVYSYSTYSNSDTYYSARVGGTRLYYRNGAWRTQNGNLYTGTEVWKTISTSTRIASEREALDTLVQQLLANNKPDLNDVVEISLVTFNIAANRVLSNSNDYNTIHDAIYRTQTNQGTNWEEGLKKALEEANALKNDEPNESVYIIFLTDGEPTAKTGMTSGYNTRYWENWSAASDEAKSAAEINSSTSPDGLFTIFTYGDEAQHPEYINFLDNLTHFAYGTKDGENVRQYSEQNFGTEYSRNQNFYNATNTSALVAAFSQISENIKTSGIGAVSITDGTTSDVQTSQGVSHLLEVDTDSFEYWLSMPVTNGVITRVNLNTGKPYEITLTDNNDGTITASSDKWGESGSVTVEGTIENNIFKYKWTESNNLYKYAPPAATFANSDVKWDLSSLGTLLDGVTYTVTFDVYPSQDTYDLIADFKNGTVDYNASYSEEEYKKLSDKNKTYYSLDSETRKYVLDSNIKKYLHKNGDSYSLDTNTEATLTYSDTRPDEHGNTINGEKVYYHNLNGELLVSQEILVEKQWNNALDGRTPTEIRKDENGEPILDEEGNYIYDYIQLDMELLKLNKTTNKFEKTNEKFHVTNTGNDDTNWKDSRYISTGLLKIDKNGNIKVLDPGYDYTLEEPKTISYHWELAIETVHPMIIGNSLKTLVEVTGNDIPAELKGTEETPVDNVYKNIDGKDYYKFNGKVYYAKYSGAKVNLNAYNNRKSYIEFKKEVTGDAPKGKEFSFEFRVNNVIGSNETDSDVWFSVCDTKKVNCSNPDTYEPIIDLDTNATAELAKDDNNNDVKTGYYYAKTNTTINVKLQDGWILRILNLGTGSDYTITEKNVAVLNDSMTTDEINQALAASNPQYFAFDKITPTIKTAGVASKYTPTITDTKIDGVINEPDSSHSYVYTNNYPGTYLTVKKEWIGTPKDSIEVELYQSINGATPEKTDKKATLKADNNWTYTFEGLPIATTDEKPLPITYSIEEISKIENYTSTITKNDSHNWTITNTELTEIEVTKTWDDANNQDGLRDANTKVKFELYADGTTTNKTVDLSGNPEVNSDTKKFTDLPKYKLVEGKLVEIVYTVKEVVVPNGYTATAVCASTAEAGAEATTTECTGANAIGTKDNNYTITNKYTPETVDITVNKSWLDANNQDGIRPNSIEVTLKANGKNVLDEKGQPVTAEIVEDEDGNWSYVFEDLPKYAGTRTPISYTVVETTSNIITGTDGKGTYAFDNGTAATIGSDNTGSITVTNTHTPETVKITATKEWDDVSNQDGVRPSAIEFQLYADNEPAKDADGNVIKCTLSEGTTASNTWTCNFNNMDLPKYNKTTTPIVYSVVELTDLTTIDNRKYGYDAPTYKEVNGKEDKLTIINKRIPETTEVPVEKVWDDTLTGEEKEETNHVAVKVTLDNTGDEITLNEGNSWKGKFENLPKYANGQKIDYTVTETKVNGYERPAYSKNEETGAITITNTISKTQITVKKQWNDENNKNNNRPDKIEVKLNYNNKTLELNKENNWTATFENLPVYVNGQEYKYTADEVSVPTGYVKGDISTSTSEDTGITTITINNNTETTTVSGTKTWADKDQEGNTIDSVTIKLKNGNEYVKDATGADLTAVASKDSNWKYEFTNLPKYINKEEVEYTVEEIVPTGYTASYDNYNITNTLNRVKITGIKKWADEYQFGNQPDSIIINLKRNGIQIDKRTVKASENWEFTFDNLPEYVDNNKAKYTIEEVTPAGYTSDTVKKSVETTNGLTTITYEITNTLDRTEFKGEKTWADGFDQSNRPDSIIVKLMTVDSDGNKSPAKDTEGKNITQEVSAGTDGRWKYEFTNLPTYVGTKAVTYTVEEDVPTGYTSEVVGNNITNTLETVEVVVEKVWKDEDKDNNQPATITVNLLANGNQAKDANGRDITATIRSNNGKWTYTFANLPKYTDKSANPIDYSVEEVEIPGYTSDISKKAVSTDGKTISYTITNTLDKKNIKVHKTWDDSNNNDNKRPDSITVSLNYNNMTVTLNEKNNWTATFENLPVYVNKEEYAYEVTEAQVDGYDVPNIAEAVEQEDGSFLIEITNTLIPETIKIEGTKQWDDANNQDDLRTDTIEVTLTGNDGTTISKTVSEGKDAEGNSMNWYFSFDNLPKYKNGKEIVYTLTESQVPGYETPVVVKTTDKDNVKTYLITNKHTPYTTKVKVTKTWDDNNNQDGVRKDVVATVQLYKTVDGKESIVEGKNATVGAADDWSTEFTDLPVNEGGKVITYSVKEELTTPAGYTKSGEDATLKAVKDNSGVINITNSRPTEKTQIKASKVWNDAYNQDGARPASVTFILLADGVEKESKTLTANEDKELDWTAVFTDLPRYRNGGTEIVYTVKEEVPSGYTSSGLGTKDNKYTITNSYEPKTTEIKFHKVWDDNDNQDNIRYNDTYEITLKGTITDGETTKEVDLSKYNPVVTIDPSVVKDEYIYKNLPVYNSGKEITYTIEETRVSKGYEADGLGSKENKYTITNTHTPETTEITVTKTWVDGDDQDGIRPENITLILYADSNEYKDAKQPEPVKNGNTWTYTYTELPKYAAGKEIKWTVSEKEVAGYIGEPEGLTITNKHTPEVIEIPVTKHWVDANNQDGKRPESIEVILLADGTKYDTLTLKGGKTVDSWTGKFTDLPRYKNVDGEGVEIEYTIKEVEGDFITGNEKTGYTSTVSGYEIINTHSPSKKTIEGTKTWDDNDNQDAIRPTSIKVNLLKNGSVIDTKEVTAEDGWSYKWENLPEYENGNRINYQIDEATTPAGYSKKVSTYDITNTHTPETVDLNGVKKWEDADDQDGIRPDSITVQLYSEGKPALDKDGKEITRVVSAETDWKFSFKGLQKFNHSTTPIEYSVIEVHKGVVNGDKETGYDADIKDVSTSSSSIEFKVTNNHVPETVKYEITKVWDDEEDNDGIRPTSITVKLLADGKVIETVTVKPDKDGNWKYTFGPLDKNKAGKEIVYTIEEDDVAGYKPSTSEPEVKNKTITQVLTNTHTPEKTSINGKKTWIDENNKDGKRPQSITVYVYANKKLIATLTVDENSNWEYALKDLYKYQNGVEIEYTIEELPIEGYETEYDGYNITNIKTEVEGEKEEFPPDTYAKDNNTYKVDYLLTLLAGLVIASFGKFIKVEE